MSAFEGMDVFAATDPFANPPFDSGDPELLPGETKEMFAKWKSTLATQEKIVAEKLAKIEENVACSSDSLEHDREASSARTCSSEALEHATFSNEKPKEKQAP